MSDNFRQTHGSTASGSHLGKQTDLLGSASVGRHIDVCIHTHVVQCRQNAVDTEPGQIFENEPGAWEATETVSKPWDR